MTSTSQIAPNQTVTMRDKLRVFSSPAPQLKTRVLLLLSGALVAVTYLLLAGSFESSSPGIIALSLLGPTMSAVDVREHRLPDILTMITGIAAGAGAIALCTFGKDWGPLGSGAMCAAITTAVFYLVALLSAGGFGLGDIKLIAVIAFTTGLHGWQVVLYCLAAAFMLGAVTAIGLRLFRRRTSEIPFGPFLVMAGIMAGLLATKIA